MDQTIEYAILSANVYATSVNKPSFNITPENDILFNSDWKLIDNSVNDNTGFLARAYLNTANNDIVIAFAGTTFEENMKLLDWTNGNFPGTIGSRLGAQVIDAAKFYLDILQTPEATGRNISFTGHSLGGGLASLMSVYFNLPAYTFDQAPFRRTADSESITDELKAHLQNEGYLLPAEFMAYTGIATREAREINVHHTYVAGEALRYLANPLYAASVGAVIGGPTGFLAGLTGALIPQEITGTEIILDPKATSSNYWGYGFSNGDPVDLHYMPLLIALCQSPALESFSQNNPELLQQIFTSELNVPQDDTKSNFLNLIVNQEIKGHSLWDLFIDDLSKTTGILGTDDLNNAVYAVAIALHHNQAKLLSDTPTTSYTTLINTHSGGISFSLNELQDKLYKQTMEELDKALKSHFHEITDFLDYKVDRITLPTEGGMITPELDDDKSDLQIGSKNSDHLYGGSGDDILLGRYGNDHLYGGSGEDTLYGGWHDDTLVGGSGYDTYVYYTGDGNDTIIETREADGSSGGRIVINNNDAKDLLSGLFTKLGSQNIWTASDGSPITLTHNSPWKIHLPDGSTIQLGETQDDFQSGDFGIRLYEEQGLPTDFDLTMLGDLTPVDFDAAQDGIQTQIDDLGNIITDPDRPEADRNDRFYDSAGQDHIQAFGGDDYILADRGGDDLIEGGDGNDIIMGHIGNNTLLGGSGSDIVHGGSGQDRIYAGSESITLHDALADQDIMATGLRGDWLEGAAEDDLVIGGADNDVVNGGNGADILIGGAGDDDICGDMEASLVTRDWSVTRTIEESSGTTYYVTTYNNIYFNDPLTGGGDSIYGGGGDDWIKAQHGDDYVDGGTGNDAIFGEEGNDDLFGGSGDDMISGDSASTPIAAHGMDYIDGEDGNDTLFGMGGDDLLFGGLGDDHIQGDAGNDYLDGEADADILFGGEGDDELFGGDGNDTLQGDHGTIYGNDYLDGEAGDDILIGGYGEDEIYGGDGHDQIAGDRGGAYTDGEADHIHGEAGNDYIMAQGGNDTVFAGDDHDIVFGGEGDDWIFGGLGDDQLLGDNGNDIIDGGEGSDILFGDADNDSLYGGAGNDYLIGSIGDDILDGGEGDDVYYYSLGEGNDHIVDSGGTDWLVFYDIFWGSIQLGVGSLKLSVPGGEIHIDNFDPDNPYAPGGIDYFQFADGTVLSKAQLISSLGFSSVGTPNDDVLEGTALDETISALSGNDFITARAGNDTIDLGAGHDYADAGDGNDLIQGGDGNDWISGGAGDDLLYGGTGTDTLAGESGNDWLEGGDGDDTYIFTRGDNNDSILDTLGNNHIHLSGNLATEDLLFSRQDNDLLIVIKESLDSLTVKEWFAETTETIDVKLDDGTVLSRDDVEALMPRNQVPVLTDDAAILEEDVTVTATGDLLDNDTDPDGQTLMISNPGTYRGDYGTLSMAADGRYQYDLDYSASQVQSLADGEIVDDTFTYIVTDGIADTVGSFTAHINGTNDAPILVNPLEDQTVLTKTLWEWRLPDNSFMDIDHGDTLTYSASLMDGSPLPSWLSFNASTLTFSGSIPKSFQKNLQIRTTATDQSGQSAHDDFELTISTDTGGGNGDIGSQANEGVGNGVDAAPAGHDTSFNDTADAAPGEPGAKYGDGYRPPERPEFSPYGTEILPTEHGASAGASAAHRFALSATDNRRTSTPEAPTTMVTANSLNGIGPSTVETSPTAGPPTSEGYDHMPWLIGENDQSITLSDWLDLLAQKAQQPEQASANSTTDASHAWQQMDVALSNHIAQAGSESASLSAAGDLTKDLPFLATANDPLTQLSVNSGLKPFAGLNEGFGQIA